MGYRSPCRGWSVPASPEKSRKRLRPVGGAYHFAHPLLREVTYATIGVARRREMDRRAAAALRIAGAPPETVAEHHGQAGEHAIAFGLAIEAAEAATQVHAIASALRLYDMALAATEAIPVADLIPGIRADLSRPLGDLRLLDGGSEGALEAYQAARRLLEAAAAAGDAGAASELVLLHCSLAGAYLRRGEDAEALRYAEMAELTPRLASPDGLAARLGLLRARIHESHANYG